jgi:plastocyanin
MPVPAPFRAFRAAIAAGALVMVFAACSQAATPAPSAAQSTPAAGGGGGSSAVTIQNFAFNPASLTVAVGTTVTWTNQDSAGHTVTADDGSFGSDTLASGATFTQTFSKAGTVAYHCNIHKTMTATIVVK